MSFVTKKMIQTFSQACDYLYSFVSFEHKKDWSYTAKTLNLQRFRNLLRQIDNPQDNLRTLHIAGSDGKGSVCAMLASVLQTAGYRVGLYISPHLEDIRERITLNGQLIPESDFIRWTNYLKDRFIPPTEDVGGYATFFELMTAMAFLYFQERQVDYAVIETGLGGRLDATNVMNPLITVITHISFEHTDRLGSTLEKIADEKLGIIRPNAPVVIAPQDDKILPHFRRCLESHPAPVVFVQNAFHVESQSLEGPLRRIAFTGTMTPEPRTVHLALQGQYQIANALTAIASLDVLQRTGQIPALNSNQLDEGLHRTVWPGRFEVCSLPNGAAAVLDVAHTSKGAAALRLSLDEQFLGRKRIFVMGFLQGKRMEEIIAQLIRPDDTLILTQAPSPRGVPVDQIAQAIATQPETLCIQTLEPNPQQALQLALGQVEPGDLLIVTGSLYLVGELRPLLKSEPTG